jgi:hypothetical protein
MLERRKRSSWSLEKGRVSDVYDDIELPFPDAKVAGKLCVGGPCKYAIKDGSDRRFSAPACCAKHMHSVSSRVAKVLAKPLLDSLFH